MKSYNEAKKLTKSELLEEYKELVEEFESLEQQYNDLNVCYGEMENSAYESNKKLEELTKPNNTNSAIISISNFIRQMKNDNLWNTQVEEFIENYLRYYNKVD